MWAGISRFSKAVVTVVCVALLAGCGMLPDFDFGSGTISASREAPAAKSPASAVSAPAAEDGVVTLDRAATERLQTRLAELGFAPGPVDGIVGPRTIEAVRRYQTAHGLPATGEISKRLLARLKTPSVRTGGTGRRAAASRPSVRLAADEYPAYQPGTTFVFSNGDVETVSGSDGATVRWRRADGATYTADRNFMLPRLHWESDAGRGAATISESVDALWPQRKGDEVAFSANVTMQRGGDPDSIVRRIDRWRCRNEGREDVVVEAGTFETVVLVCERGPDAGSPEIMRTWYYAKDVRHYVRYIDSDPQGDEARIVDLVAARPGAAGWPPIVRAALSRALVHALETPDDEARMPWTSSAVNTHVTIDALSRFVAADGSPCRRFVQVWTVDGRRWLYPAVACATAPGRWEIPGLESDTGTSLATSGGIS
jgi:hypothetical protein